MAYSAKKYVDLTGLERFKNDLEDQVSDMISLATENLTADIGYNIEDHPYELTITTADGDTTTITTADNVVTQNSTNLVTSGAVYTVVGDIESLLASI